MKTILYGKRQTSLRDFLVFPLLMHGSIMSKVDNSNKRLNYLSITRVKYLSTDKIMEISYLCAIKKIHNNLVKYTFQTWLNIDLIISDSVKIKMTGFENGRIGYGKV